MERRRGHERRGAAGRTAYSEVHVDCVSASDARVVRVVHISDTHHDEDLLELPQGDVLIHSGDFFHWRSSVDFDADIDRLNRFFGKQPHRHKVGRIPTASCADKVIKPLCSVSK